MSKYKYIIRDYHAIKEAEIKLDGITVLSGINGCGKSTLSRWLYYLINGAKGFETFLFEEYKDKIGHILNRIQIACVDLERFIRNDDLLDKTSLYNLIKITNEFDFVKYKRNIKIETIERLFLQALYNTKRFLSETMSMDLPDTRKARIFNYLNIDVEDKNFNQAIECFFEQNARLINKLSSQLKKDIKERDRNKFFDLINEHFEIQNDIPSFIQLEEDDVDIIEKEHISTLFNMQQAVYIDTPMAVEMGDTENILWKALRDIMINEEQIDEFSLKEKKLMLRVKGILEGETVLEKGDLFKTNSLRYVSKDKKVNILLKDAATGFKTFSYLQRLLENGLLNDETLLMIDEPEAHLHPQWIVEFARLLVLLNKELGLKIMIASHNPDMVAAIHDIANKEGVLENTNFYVAQPENPKSHQYIFKDLGHDVGEIFESFNIALDNIGRYGRVDL